MKVKNIVFSGIMAAILGATAADAAISVASQAYVDGKIKTNADAISELSQTVADNKTAADATATLVGTLPEGATATTIVGYITEKTTGIATDAKVNELGETVAGQGEKITALETLTGENGQIAQNIAKTLQDAKDYADGLATNYDAAGSAAAAETAAKGYTDTTVAGLDADQVGADGSYIKLVSQADGKVSATAASFEGSVTDGSTSVNAPTTAAVASYVQGKLKLVTGDEGIAGLQTQITEIKDSDVMNSGVDADVVAQVATNKADIAAMDAAYKLADTNLETSLKTYADQAEADAVATAAADATSKADAAQAAAIAAAADAAKIYIDDDELTASQTAQNTELKGYTDVEVKKVQDSLKFLATAEVPSECTSGSAYCVLTMTTGGAFAWTPLTSPVEE